MLKAGGETAIAVVEPDHAFGGNLSSISSEPAAIDVPSGTLGLSSADDPLVWGIRRSTWIQVGVIAALFAAVYWPNLRRLWLKTNPFTGDGNWSHSIFVPLIGLYYLYVNREALLSAPVKTSWSGLGILIGGLLLSMLSVWPIRNDFIWDLGMVAVLFGVVLFLCGWGVMRIAWFPLVFLLCALPLPGLIYSEIASPLQVLAAKVAVKVLEFTGVDAGISGTKILMSLPPDKDHPEGALRILNVAEACAGMRSLMTFISLGAAIAFLSSRALWQKLVITFSAIPIAIFCNVVRVSGQGLIDRYVTQKLSEGFAHAFVGMVMLIPAFFLLLAVGWVMDHLFIEEVDEASRRKAAAAKSTKILIPQRPAPTTVPASIVPKAAAPAAVVVIPRPATAQAKAIPRPAILTAPKPAAAPAPQMKIPPRPGMANRPAPARRPPQASQPTDPAASTPTTTVNPNDPRRAQP